MRRKKFFKPIGLIDFVVFISFVALSTQQLYRFADDPGVGWHLKAGELIAQTGSVPRSDPFLFYPEPRAWISDQWGSDSILFLLFESGGFPLVYSTLSSIFFITFLFLLYKSLLDYGCGAIPSCCASFIALKLGSSSFLLRPVIFSFLFFTLTLWILFRLYQQYSPRSKRSPYALRRSIDHKRNRLNRALLFLLPPLFALWANIHPSFPLGLAVVGLLAVALAIESLPKNIPISEKRVGYRGIGVVGLSLIGSTLATLLNPYGIELHNSILALVANDYFMQMNLEWAPPSFGSPNLYFLLFTLLSVVILQIVGGKRSLSVFELLLLGMFTYLAFSAQRYGPYFGIVAAFPLARLLGYGALFRRFKERAFLQLFQRLERRERQSYGGAVIYPMIFLSAIFSIFLGRVPFYRGDFGPSKESYPHAAVRFLTESKEISPGSGVVAPAQWGGFITFYSGGKLKPLVDDRNTLIGEDFYQEFYRRFNVDGDWREYLAERGVSVILVPRESRFGQKYGQGVLPVLFEDSLAVVLLNLNRTQG